MLTIRNRICAAVLATLLVALSLVGCRSTNPTEQPGTEPATSPATTPDTNAGTDTPPDEPDLSSVALTATALAVGDDGLTLTLHADTPALGDDEISLAVILGDADGEIARATPALVSGEIGATLACPADRLGGELTLTVSIPADESAPTLTLKLKNKLPQLTADGIELVIAAMTLEEKAHLVTGNRDLGKAGASGGTYPIPRLGVPMTLCMDGPAGIRYDQSVWYPSVANVTSSWDTALATRVGESLGEDALAHGFDIVLAPGANIQKNVVGGRNFEYASEDPILTGLMIAPYVNGIESTGAGTALKHYAANNQETARSSVSANVTERALREIYLKGFGIVVKDAQPMTVMSSYNRINGTYSAVNSDLLTGILREEFGFEGMVMSDWGAQGAIADKVNAGNDINMPGTDDDPDAIMEAYRSGYVTDASLNAACRNILTMVAASATAQGVKMNTRVDYRGHGEIATDAATKGMVLLQNDSAALPLAGGTKVAVFGAGAADTVFGGSGSGGVTPMQSTNILTGLTAADGLTVVNAAAHPLEDAMVTATYAAEMAAAADVAVVVISRGSAEGADNSIGQGAFLLSDAEAAMIERLSNAFHEKGGHVVVLLNTGSPIEVVSWRESVDAILWVGYPGQGAGTAVARVLTGAVNPSGKTTITWPATYASTPYATTFPGSAMDVTYYEDIYVGYRYYTTFDVEVAYPFGYGLSYTTFTYSDYAVEKNSDGTVTATVTVKNTGKVAGREVVELYVSKPETLQEQAALELCGFAKTATLAPGESETVTITVREEALTTYDTAGSRWVIPDGSYTYSIAASVADIRGEKTVNVTANEARTVQDVENRCVPRTELDYIQKATYGVPDGEDTRVSLAKGKPVTSNYDEAGYPAAQAVDGDPITRWSGLGLSTGTYHTLTIDLEEVCAIGEFRILWESIYAPFVISTSTDGKTYTTFGEYLHDGTMRTEINLFGTEARYVRIEVARSGNYISIYEVEMFEATEADIEAGKDRPVEVLKPNIAVGKPVTVSSVEGDYVAANAVDGDFATRWSAPSTGEGWILLDLEEATPITGLHIIFESSWEAYTVEYSADGEIYTSIYEGMPNETVVKLTDLSIGSARYIRVRRNAPNWFSIYEIMVYNE